MMWILKMLFLGHIHEWETKETWPMCRGNDPAPIGNRYMCRCVKCGEMRKFDCF